MGFIGVIAVVATVVVVGLSVVSRAAGPVGPVAPRLSAGLAPNLLARAGFPATAHNVAVLHDHLGSAFLEDARAVLPTDVFTVVHRRCTAARGGVPVSGGSSRAWPQRVLDELAADGSTDVAALPLRCQEALLATAGTGQGLFGGSVFAPLPALSDAARARLVPTTGVVPVPRPATDTAARPVPA